MQKKGKITSWNDEKGFGFITPVAGGKDVFIHINAFGKNIQRPRLNQLVTYALSSDNEGRPCAVKAMLVGKGSIKGNRKNSLLSFSTFFLFLICVGISIFLFKVSPLIFLFYLVISILTYVIYAVDKSAAKNGRWRTSENTLHFFSLIGGWPGALIAQQQLRHKSKKQPFRFIFWLTVLVNISVFILLFTPVGTIKLPSSLTLSESSQIQQSLPELSTPNFLIKIGDTLKSWYKSQKSDKSVQVYKWQDENGVWHFSENAPTSDGKNNNISRMKVNTGTN